MEVGTPRVCITAGIQNMDVFLSNFSFFKYVHAKLIRKKSSLILRTISVNKKCILQFLDSFDINFDQNQSFTLLF